jgi:tetratricopeptide (TPR) repeat protein
MAGVEAWRELSEAFPNMPFFRKRLGVSWTNLGNFRRYLDEHDGAVAATREAVAVYDELVASLPEVVEHRQGLGRALLNLGSMLVRSKDQSEHAEGRAVLERALGVAEPLRREDPGDAEHARLVADCLGESAYVESGAGDHAQARRLYERAARAWGEGMARHPANIAYRDGQANMLRGAARELLALGDAASALAVADETLVALRDGLAKEPRQPARRRYARNSLAVRAEACAKLGDHAAAHAALAELAALADSAADCGDAAATAVECMRGLTAGARGGYIDAALAAFTLLCERGYEDAAELAGEERFAGLRGDPRFQELQRRLKQ